MVPKELKELSSLSVFNKANKKYEIALVDFVKNTFNISVLFDTFSDILDKGLLPSFVSVVRRIGELASFCPP